jgi:hypothetical protein
VFRNKHEEKGGVLTNKHEGNRGGGGCDGTNKEVKGGGGEETNMKEKGGG